MQNNDLNNNLREQRKDPFKRKLHKLLIKVLETKKVLACVAGVKRGRGDFGTRVQGKERLQGDHCFLHFSRSDSERENSDWSELIKCQSST